MCLLMRGRYLNQVCNNPVLRGVALSFVPSEMSKVTVRKFDVSAHTRLMNWFREAVSIDLQLAEDAQSNLVSFIMLIMSAMLFDNLHITKLQVCRSRFEKIQMDGLRATVPPKVKVKLISFFHKQINQL